MEDPRGTSAEAQAVPGQDPQGDRGGLASGAVSGLATGIFSIPEGMAYAQLAG